MHHSDWTKIHSRRGAAPGPPGMTVLRPLLDNPRDLHALFLMAETVGARNGPEAAVRPLRLGRLTALRKPTGGVRGIVAGDILRRLVSRTIAQQLSDVVKNATSPFQYALSTRAGCECIAHALQGVVRARPERHHLVNRWDWCFRSGVSWCNVAGASQCVSGFSPIRANFYGTPSRYLWEDDEGVTHNIREKAANKGTPRVMANFGQTDFGPNRLCPIFDRLWPIVGLTDFGQTNHGQFQCFSVLTNFSVVVVVVLCCCCVGVVLLLCWCCVVVVCCCGSGWCLLLWLWFVLVVWLLVWTALRRTSPPPDRPKFRSFFPSPTTISLCLCLSGVFSLNFGGFCEAPGPSNVHVWALGLSCEAPAALFFV